MLARYQPLLVSWRAVEAYLAAEYGLSLPEIRGLKWRRFTVLVERGFTMTPSDQKPKVAESDLPGADFDWSIMDRAIGRETPTHVTKMSLDEFMKVM